MARRFSSKEDLDSWLASLEPIYREEGYAAKLWDAKVRSTAMLADARCEDLQQLGLSPIHATNIIKRAAGVAGPGPSTAAGGAEPGPDNVSAGRVKYCAKFGAHIKLPSPSGEVYKTAAVVVTACHIATYAHGDHKWTVGQEVEVYTNNVEGAQRKAVMCVVTSVNVIEDFVILTIKNAGEVLEAPVLDAAMYAGMKYLLLGQSAQAHADETSVSHGRMAATEHDAHHHVRGDMLTGSGDSGGAVFDEETGKLIAMCVGCDGARHKGVFVPISAITNAITINTITSH